MAPYSCRMARTMFAANEPLTAIRYLFHGHHHQPPPATNTAPAGFLSWQHTLSCCRHAPPWPPGHGPPRASAAAGLTRSGSRRTP